MGGKGSAVLFGNGDGLFCSEKYVGTIYLERLFEPVQEFVAVFVRNYPVSTDNCERRRHSLRF